MNFNTGHNPNVGPQISFDRPELSPYLAGIKDKNSPEYSQAIAIIQQGAVMLKSRPGVDMDGYVPCLEHQKRQKTYEKRYKKELLNRKAILAGRKVYGNRGNTQYVER